jgi:hypothetical protein
MTGPIDTLERSLRDGPPDEASYRALPPAQRARTGSSWGYMLAALVVIALAAGGIAYTSSRIGSGPVAAPSPTYAPLTKTFTSPRNGFSIRYPEGWTVKPGTAAWPVNVFLPVGNPGLDELTRPGMARLVVASQPLGSGQTEADWLAAYFHPYEGNQHCGGEQSTWPRLPISSATGYLDASGCPWSAEGRISQPDVWYDAIVFSGGRVYQIGLDGNVDLRYFKAVLAAIALDPASAVD